MECAWAVARNLISRYSLLWEMVLPLGFVSLRSNLFKSKSLVMVWFFFFLAYFILNQAFIFKKSSNSSKVIW